MNALRTAAGTCVAALLIACQPVTRPPTPVAVPAPAREAVAAGAPVVPPAPDISPPAEAPESQAALSTGAAVFEHLRAQLAAPVCDDNADSRHWRQRYGGHPDTFARRLEAVLPLLAYVLDEVEKRDLPGEFALIPWVESGFRPDAMGLGGPAGLWQMVSATGRNNGLQIDRQYDGRLSPHDSTAAALQHLQAMQQRFGNWQAAVMAYNAGEYRLQQALRRAGNAEVAPHQRRPAGLSRTTYEYVAKLQALACLIAEPQAHGIRLPTDARFQPLQVVTLPAGIVHLDQAAVQLGLDARQLRALNPGHRLGRVAADAPREVLSPATIWSSTPPPAAPAESARDVAREHVVQAGDTLSALARRYGVRLDDLLRWNGLQLRSVLRLGQRLRVASP